MSRLTGPEVGSYAGGTVAVVSSLTLTEIGIIVGITTALLTFALNVWYTRRKSMLEQKVAAANLALAKAQLAKLQGAE